MLEQVIEGMLMAGPSSGYDIKQNLETGKMYSASFGSIYPALKRMEAEGLIDSEEVIQGGKYKKLYKINENGREKFLDWLEKPSNIIKSDSEHLAKLMFYQYLPKEKVNKSIFEFIKSVTAIIRRMEVLEKVLGKNLDIYQRSALSFQTQQYRFVKEWYMKFLDDNN